MKATTNNSSAKSNPVETVTPGSLDRRTFLKEHWLQRRCFSLALQFLRVRGKAGFPHGP